MLAPRLLRYCLGRLGEPGLAEEASQEALAALVQRWRRHGPPASPPAFAFAVARRRAARLAWRRRLLAPWSESRNGHREDAASRLTARPDDLYAPRERLARTVAALAELPAGQRETLLLTAVGELRTAEVASVQGISLSAVKMRLHRARRRLEELLGEVTDD